MSPWLYITNVCLVASTLGIYNTIFMGLVMLYTTIHLLPQTQMKQVKQDGIFNSQIKARAIEGTPRWLRSLYFCRVSYQQGWVFLSLTDSCAFFHSKTHVENESLSVECLDDNYWLYLGCFINTHRNNILHFFSQPDCNTLLDQTLQKEDSSISDYYSSI